MQRHSLEEFSMKSKLSILAGALLAAATAASAQPRGDWDHVVRAPG
jgi:hypothetical protein